MLGFNSITNTVMTDIETNEDVEEKKESWYAKLRASLKEKYEGQINDLQAKITELESSHASTKKQFFNRALKAEGYEWNFDDFADKYSNLWIDEMVALYKGLNGVKTASTPEQSAEQPKEELWAKSVLWTNPTDTQTEVKVDQMDGKQYLDYLKQNMSKLGLA